MREIKKCNITELKGSHKNIHPDYEYYRKDFLPNGFAQHCKVSVYEIPPKKSSCPYHYHCINEEVFYILEGKGLLRTKDGEQEVNKGDFIYFPANENGAHKITNISETETLKILDFDTCEEMDVSIYPDSGKIGIWGKNTNKVYLTDKNVDYYEGE